MKDIKLCKKQKTILSCFALVVFLGGCLFGYGMHKLKLRIDEISAKQTYVQTYHASKELQKESTQQMLTNLNASWQKENGDQRMHKPFKISK